ncbi:hypothetical protein BKG77_01620 [Mycobacteroides chelonae]|uniref:Luciferase-like domain-containing protein n=1 Tax=Mycobacteroides chelonae TaxID=1774 RepID=A0A1S1LUH1_MYCCH|nr:TIGR03619 family F420-dependent LLM class oxidoreductase [Mycobacteroides chelonae]OHU28266.1 hypothetical protein BKG77_01620 [Mycobacteroides chelonae]OHU63687.1 hypothetical protein BKG85_09295 [Mycobacteroides chelonae]OHU76424.1 hypothetical protein BKG84_24310 [Mycobacteroides chelonae]QQG88319.1 TIGR03619 family F420-dependent LLM class oxidoreductase [Mycobacteroides chelonae]QQG93136.1 TIGR03619 family F420-dependent LLM class oxidoreductase [Mycobacteroides chelonae]
MTPQDNDRPTVGLFAVNMQPTVHPAALGEIATLAEELGYDSLWAGEHVVLPDSPESGSPFDPALELVDPLITLAHLSGVTRTIKLATGVVILPLHNPLLLAKQLASLDVLCNGRLIFGYGNGYLEQSFDAVGVPFADRASRSNEYLRAMRALWHTEKPAYTGSHVSFSQVDAHPRPLQRSLHTVVGGASTRALREAATHAHGWYAWGMTPDALAEAKNALDTMVRNNSRAEELGRIQITVTPPQGATVGAAQIDAFGAAGADRIVLFPPDGLTIAELRAFIRAHAPAAIGAMPAPISTPRHEESHGHSTNP